MANLYLLTGSSEDGLQNIRKSLPAGCRCQIEEIIDSRKQEKRGKKSKKRVFRIRMARRHEPFLQRLSKAFGYSVERLNDKSSVQNHRKGERKMNGKALQEELPAGEVHVQEPVPENVDVHDKGEEPVEVPSPGEARSSQESLLVHGAGVDKETRENEDLLVSDLKAMIQQKLEDYDGEIAGLNYDRQTDETAIQRLQSQIEDINRQIEGLKQRRGKFVDNIVNLLS